MEELLRQLVSFLKISSFPNLQYQFTMLWLLRIYGTGSGFGVRGSGSSMSSIPFWIPRTINR
jgi:hypothetical protein